MATASFSDLTPYASAAPLYLDLGWWPLPLQGKGRGKGPVPTGFTGYQGKPVTAEDVDGWIAEKGGWNVALRLGRDACGIDVDCYDGKRGADTLAELEKEYGKLPPAWTSTSREDGSKVRVYRKPASVKLPGVAGQGVEIIQFHHRYMVAWPSVHPDTGAKYQWFSPEGKRAAPPRPEDLTDLPAKWYGLKALAAPAASSATGGERDSGYTDPDIELLLIEGIADGENQDEILRDVCWKLVCEGRVDEEAGRIWRAITEKSPVLRAGEPWTEEDFQRHLKGARAKAEPGEKVSWPEGMRPKGSGGPSSSEPLVASPSAPRDVALEYLRQKLGFVWKAGGEVPRLLTWRQEFYEHGGSYWEPVEDDKILQNLDSWLAGKFFLKAARVKGEDEFTPVPWQPTEAKLKLVLASLRLLVRLPSEAVAGCLLVVVQGEDGPRLGWEDGQAHVPLQDGAFHIAASCVVPAANRYFDHWCVPVTRAAVLACVRAESGEQSMLDDLEKTPLPLGLPSSVQAVHPLSSESSKGKKERVSSIVVEERAKKFFPLKVVRVCLDSLDWADMCPSWVAQLNLIFGGDMGTCAQLQEFFGYCLTTDTSLQRALLVYGRPRSGKGTLARVLKTLVGTIASPTVDNYAKGGFQLKRLIGKSVAVTWDAKFTARVPFNAVERIKSIIGEDDVQIDRKYLDPWEGKLVCKLVFIANEQPTFPDASGAIGSKFVILKTATSWIGAEDFAKEKALYEELPGILLWSLAGWHRLQEQGKFTETAKSREMTDDLERNASPVKQFLEDDLVIDITRWQKSADIYEAYTRWCWANGYPVLAANEYGKRSWYYSGAVLAPHVKLPEGLSVM